MKFFIRTLGCKMNWLDSARMGAALENAGHAVVSDETVAEYVLINTCTVTAEADRKSHQQANTAKKKQKQVAVVGCSTRVEQDKWAANDELLVFQQETQMLEHFGVDTKNLPFPLTSRTRLPIAIQTGCDNSCSFCITRIARGTHSNVPADSIIEHIKEAEQLGIKEIVLTGINLAAWGCDNTNNAQQSRIHELLKRILSETRMPRIRLSSLGPEFIQSAFFDVFADQRICDYLHLSIQSGSPGVLKRMQRGHGIEEVYNVAERARKVRPDVAIATDLISGFPGETELEFRETLKMVSEIHFAKLHVFPFSIREGTTAANMDEQVEQSVKKQRASILRNQGKDSRQEFIQSQLGKIKQVLVEAGENGWTSNYLRVNMPMKVVGLIYDEQLTEKNLLELN